MKAVLIRFSTTASVPLRQRITDVGVELDRYFSTIAPTARELGPRSEDNSLVTYFVASDLASNLITKAICGLPHMFVRDVVLVLDLTADVAEVNFEAVFHRLRRG